jgi:hypothetical protein
MLKVFILTSCSIWSEVLKNNSIDHQCYHKHTISLLDSRTSSIMHGYQERTLLRTSETSRYQYQEGTLLRTSEKTRSQYQSGGWFKQKLVPEEFECQIKISYWLTGLFDLRLDLSDNLVKCTVQVPRTYPRDVVSFGIKKATRGKQPLSFGTTGERTYNKYVRTGTK